MKLNRDEGVVFFRALTLFVGRQEWMLPANHVIRKRTVKRLHELCRPEFVRLCDLQWRGLESETWTQSSVWNLRLACVQLT